MALARQARGGTKDTKLAKQSLLSATETTWRKWRAFIREKQDEIQRRQVDAAVLDDLTMIAGTTSEVFRAKLTAAERQEMSAILESRRQNAQRQAEAQARQTGTPVPDVEQVLAEVVQRISDELEGKCTKSGMALMYFEGELMEFNHQAIANSTSDDDYMMVASGASRQKQMRMLVIGGVALVAVAIIALIVFRPFAAKSSASAAAPTALVGQQSTELWNVKAVTIGDVRSPIAGASVGYPLLICISDAQQKLATAGTEIRIEGTQSVRTYRLNADTQSMPRDLVVANCAVSPPQMLRSAGLIETQTSRLLDASLIQYVTVWAPDTNPAAIPADRMQVDLLVTDPKIGANTLILADGTRWAATKSTPENGAVRLSYLVPLSKTAQEAGWEVRQDDTLPGLLSVELPAPTSRARLLRDRVQVSDGVAKVVTRDGQSFVSLTLTLALAQGADDLPLLPGDILVSREDGAAIANVQWTPPTLAPKTPATVQVEIPLDSRRSSLEVVLANYRARVGW